MDGSSNLAVYFEKPDTKACLLYDSIYKKLKKYKNNCVENWNSYGCLYRLDLALGVGVGRSSDTSIMFYFWNLALITSMCSVCKHSLRL